MSAALHDDIVLSMDKHREHVGSAVCAVSVLHPRLIPRLSIPDCVAELELCNKVCDKYPECEAACTLPTSLAVQHETGTDCTLLLCYSPAPFSCATAPARSPVLLL